MKLYWYKLQNDRIVAREYEVKETANLYKCEGKNLFPHYRMTIEKRKAGNVLTNWGCEHVFFTEKNLKKARDLFVEHQKRVIEDNKNRVLALETKIKELERQIERLKDMVVK